MGLPARRAERSHARLRQHDVGRDARNGTRDAPRRRSAPPRTSRARRPRRVRRRSHEGDGYAFVAALGLLALLLARRRSGCPVRRHILVGGAGLVLVGRRRSRAEPHPLRDAPQRVLPRSRPPDDQRREGSRARGRPLRRAERWRAPFWPLATLLVAMLLAAPVVRAVRGASSWREAWPSAALLLVVARPHRRAGHLVGPVRLVGLGPRLSLPWVLPILLVAVAALRIRALTLPRPRPHPGGRPRRGAILVVVAALPHVGLVWRPRTIGDFFFRAETAACPGGGPPPTPEYYDCLGERMWTRHPILLDALGGVGTPGGIVTVALVTLVVVGCLLRFRGEAAERLSTPRGRSAPPGSSAR